MVIGDDDTAGPGQNFHRKSIGNRKVKLVGEWLVIVPFFIGAEIGHRGFHLGHQEPPTLVKTDHIDPPVGLELKLGDGAISQIAQMALDAARDVGGGQRPRSWGDGR